jgi:putative PIN family toxin of toxin-antitoxin system
LASVTADTNIYISGLEFGGQPRNFLDLARAGIFRLDISDAIKQEVLRVLCEKFKYSSEALLDVEVKLDSITHHVTPRQTLDVIEADPSDNRILECAVAAESDSS